nr:hypothetical protein [Neobacillus sp. Marseille-Q6967]
MLPRGNGYFLLELLLSLAAWFMLGLFFIPLFIDMTNQAWQLGVERKANQLIFEELQAKLNDPSSFFGYTVSDNGLNYRVDWNESAAGQKEVCVQVEKDTFLYKACKRPE